MNNFQEDCLVFEVKKAPEISPVHRNAVHCIPRRTLTKETEISTVFMQHEQVLILVNLAS